MVSEMAMEDVEAFRSNGIEVPPREVVRLNALGLRVENAAHAPYLHSIPRAAELCGVLFREPTIGAEMWLARAMSVCAMDLDTLRMLRALETATPLDELPEPECGEAMRGALEALKKRLAGATVRQLDDVISWVVRGADHRAEEFASADACDQAGAETDDDGDFDFVPLAAGVLYNGVLLHLGTPGELRRMRTGELMDLTLQAQFMKFGQQTMKTRHAEALGNYLVARDAVRDAAKAKKEAGGNG